MSLSSARARAREEGDAERGVTRGKRGRLRGSRPEGGKVRREEARKAGGEDGREVRGEKAEMVVRQEAREGGHQARTETRK